MKIESDFGKKAFNLQREPTGFYSPKDVIITGDSSTRTVTLTGTVDAYWRGCKVSQIVSGWTSPAHGTDTSEVYLLKYDGLTISWEAFSSIDPDAIFYNLNIAYAFYNPTDAVWVYERECHGLMQWQSHRQDHRQEGTYKVSGGGLGDYTLSSTTAANRRPSVEASLLFDEDLPTTIPALSAGGPYTQFYISGASGTPNFITNGADIVPLSTNQPYFNEFTGGAWQQTLMNTSNYMSIWLLEIPMASDTNSQKISRLWVQGQSQTLNLDVEKAKTTASLNLGTFLNITPESIFTKRLIIQYIGGNWQIVFVENITGTRTSQVSSPAGNYLSSVTTDSTLTGLGTVSSPLGIDLSNENTWTATQTFSGITMTGDLDMGSNDIISNISDGQVVFSDSGTLAGDSNFNWDNTAKSLTLGIKSTSGGTVKFHGVDPFGGGGIYEPNFIFDTSNLNFGFAAGEDLFSNTIGNVALGVTNLPGGVKCHSATGGGISISGQVIDELGGGEILIGFDSLIRKSPGAINLGRESSIVDATKSINIGGDNSITAVYAIAIGNNLINSGVSSIIIGVGDYFFKTENNVPYSILFTLYKNTITQTMFQAEFDKGLRIGAISGETQTMTGDDLYVAGHCEVDGILYAEGTTIIDTTMTLSSGSIVDSTGAIDFTDTDITASNLSGTNTGDQTSIVGITGTKSQFDTALTDGDFAYSGGAFHDGFSDYVANEHIDWTNATENLATTGLINNDEAQRYSIIMGL